MFFGDGQRILLASDARFAMAACLAYSIALFLVETWAGMAFFAVVLVAVLSGFRVPLKKIRACLLPLLFILACTLLAQIPQGIENGLIYVVRIVLLALATLTVAFSYDASKLVSAFSDFLSPLRALRVPVDDVATMFSVALRFMPECLDEWRYIVNAQRCRCAPFDRGSFVRRVFTWGGVFVPMLVGLFRRAGLLANALESRCYGAVAQRTSLHCGNRLGIKAWFCLVLICAVLLAAGVAL